MVFRELNSEMQKAMEQVLGYLNFSSGAPDAKFLGNLNSLFSVAEEQSCDDAPWRRVVDLLEEKLRALQQASETFKDTTQASAVIELLRDDVLPGYLRFHADLLFHQNEHALFNSFFVGRTMEAILQQGPPWEEKDRIRRGAVAHLNDYIGYRPVATLESQKIEPYSHEWVRPIPIYVRGAGAATGRYQAVVEATIELLESADEAILRAAYCDPRLLDELAIDPRAYDFDHPVNKRPNYHFGQWDPNHIDNSGFYRRYVVQQVTLDSLMERLEENTTFKEEEMLFEAAAVLAGTIIMSTGVSGAGPDSHDSSASLATLLPIIAGYRDAFYERLLQRLQGPHGQRLRAEAKLRRQPFGGARQHLNAALARRRASQLEHVHLATLFARMGFAEAATEHANVVPAASARMLCQIDCRLAAGDLAVERASGGDDLATSLQLLREIMDWLRRGIECGAIIDPWNILGFDANFSLFQSLENSVRDHRADELVALMEQIFSLYSRVWSEAAARDQTQLCHEIAEQFHETALWWRKFAVHEVSSVEAVDVDDVYRAAEHVAGALNLWHKAGAAAEDIAFWAPHADIFDSAKAYALVINALLEQGDFVASMALLIHWLGRGNELGLELGDTSFFVMAERWMLQLRQRALDDSAFRQHDDPWKMARKFLDYLEANAEEFWLPPSFELGAGKSSRHGDSMFNAPHADEDEDDDDANRFESAYEDVVYRDSTDDGIDGAIEEYGAPSDDEFVRESKRLAVRLEFHATIARLWQMAVTITGVGRFECDENASSERCEVILRWIDQAVSIRRGLKQLLDEVANHRLPKPTGDHDSMVDYDRARLMKEALLEQVIQTSVEIADAARLLLAMVYQSTPDVEKRGREFDFEEDHLQTISVFAAILRSDAELVQDRWDTLIDCLIELPLLYVPLSRGGDPHAIVTARVRQRCVQDMLACLPRLGLIVETCELLETAREMERLHSVGHGAVTEFDELFRIGYKSLVEMIVRSAPDWDEEHQHGISAQLVECLKRLTESLLSSWLAHSKTLRLSVLEKVRSKREWAATVSFIEKYGEDLFTQRFLNLANIRAILFQGVAEWLDQVERDMRDEADWRLLDDIEAGKLVRGEAVERLTLILEAVTENYGEYRDYNSMTTQSDRGELLYTLLDFLRLRTKYDRICWQLKPVIWAHEILVRRNQKGAARLWRRELTDQTRLEAAGFLEKLAALQKKYAMRMPTVADRLAERFVRPMAIDRIRALVAPAIQEAKQGGPHPVFDLLKHETNEFVEEPTGVGLDVPAWLVALEEELDAATQLDGGFDEVFEIDSLLTQTPLTLEETQRQLKEWSSRS